MMIIAIISLLLLHFTDEEIESEGLGVRQGLAKTYNWGPTTKLYSANTSWNLPIRKKKLKILTLAIFVVIVSFLFYTYI